MLKSPEKPENESQLTSLFPRRRREPRPWVVKGHAMRGQVTALFGDPGCGKSLLSLHMAVAVASGQSWGPFDVQEQGPVLMINREDDIAETDLRTWGIEHVQSIPKGCPVIRLDRRSVHIVERDREDGKLGRTPFFNELMSLIEKVDAKMVVLDPMIELSGNLSENDNIEMNFLVESLRLIARQCNCAVVIVHNTNKGGTGMNGMRGASAVAGRVRSANQLMILPKDHGLKIEGDPRNYRLLTSAKQNYAPSANDHHFEAKAYEDVEESGEWCPALPPLLLAQKVDEREVGAAMDGLRDRRRYGWDRHMCDVAAGLGLSTKELKTVVDLLVGERKLELEDKPDKEAKSPKPYFKNMMEPPPDIPF